MASASSNSSGGQGSGNPNISEQASLNEVLRFAIANTPTDGGPEPEKREPLTEEKKEFLNKVFNNMVRDEIKEMKEHVGVLRELQGSEREEDQEQKGERLEALQDLCETIDGAQDFLKVGGIDIVMALCHDPNSEVRWRALELLAMSVQNNPLNQNAMLERSALKMFLKLLDSDSAYQVRVKALYAISCLVRENDAAQDAFIRDDGFSFLMRAMQSDIEKLQIKAAFLLSALLWEQPKFNDILHNMGMVQQLVHLLQAEHRMYHEHIMNAVLHLVSQHSGCRGDALHPELGFKSFLAERVKELTGKDEFQEELEYSQKLVELFSKDSKEDTGTGADR